MSTFFFFFFLTAYTFLSLFEIVYISKYMLISLYYFSISPENPEQQSVTWTIYWSKRKGF